MRNEGGHPSVAGRPYLSGALDKIYGGPGVGDVMSSFLHREAKKRDYSSEFKSTRGILFYHIVGEMKSYSAVSRWKYFHVNCFG